MPMKRISQREARKLRKALRELQTTHNAMLRTWGSDYPGVHIATVSLNDDNAARVKTAIKLGRPAVLREANGSGFYVYAASV